MKKKTTKLQRLNNQDADGNFLNLEPKSTNDIVISRENFNNVREQIQEDLMCLLGAYTNNEPEFTHNALCQIVIDNFNKLDLTN